jgi:anti-anti-sigma factor
MAIIDNTTEQQINIFIDQTSIEGDMAIELKNTCKKHIEQKSRNVHLDLSKVKYLDSASIGSILYLIQLLKKENNKVFVEKITEELKQLFSSLLIDQFVIIK